jgi:hypothetical protein
MRLARDFASHMGDRDPFVLLGTSCHQPRRCLGGHDANHTKIDAGLDRRIVSEVATSGPSSEMAKAESRWRASYTPGEWMVLAEATSLMALDPATSDLDAAVTLSGFGRLQTPDLHDRCCARLLYFPIFVGQERNNCIRQRGTGGAKGTRTPNSLLAN